MRKPWEFTRSVPQGTRFYADVVNLTPLIGNKEESKKLMVLRVRPTSNQFPANFFLSWWAAVSTRCVVQVGQGFKNEPLRQK